MEDYEYLWSTLRDSYPCWGILEREGVEVERIYTTYREMVAESDSDADFTAPFTAPSTFWAPTDI